MLASCLLALAAGPPSLLPKPPDMPFKLAEAEAGLAEAARLYGERHTRYALALGHVATVNERDHLELLALPMRRRQEAILRDLGGRRWPARIEALTSIGRLCWRLNRPVEGERLLREALDTGGWPVSNWDRERARRVNLLGLVVQDQGRIAEAIGLYERAIDAGDVMTASGNAGNAYQDLGDYRRALRRHDMAGLGYKALAVLPEFESAWGLHLANLGGLLNGMGDPEEAERLFDVADDVFKGRLAKHRNHATLLNNKAFLLIGQGKPKEALKLLEKAVAITPGDPPIRQNIGRAHLMLNEDAEAEKSLLMAQEFRIARGATAHPNYGHGQILLGLLAAKKGDVARALALSRQASDIYRKAGGPNAPSLAVSLRHEAELYRLRGDTAQASRLALRALQIARLDLQRAAENLPERMQMARLEQFRAHVDTCLSLGGAGAYTHLLAAKGIVLDRQRKAREAARRSANPRTVELALRLDKATRKMAELRDGKDQRAFVAAVRGVEGLERDLALSVSTKEAATPTPEALARLLPEDAALVDVFLYQKREPKAGGMWEPTPSLVAFVVRRERAVERVDLGEAAAIEKSVAAWRAKVERHGTPAEEGINLAKLLLEPLRPHMAGVKSLLVSPDGPAARIPWGALPGRKKGTYLLEDMAVSVVAVPRLLATSTTTVPASPRMLVVGGVDYDATPGHATPGGLAIAMRGGRVWMNLDATRGEARSISQSFEAAFKGKASSLVGEEATEENVRSRLVGKTFLHFATHGYFARAEETRARPPGLLSGLVFAGANRRPQPGQDDGYLMASEIAEADLSACRLAVLSACETGRGPSAGGEGLLGLQRAFQVAGASGVVASLWEVPDGPTALLMSRFYDNLWKKKLPPAEALRQAQLYVLRDGSRHPEAWRGIRLPGEPAKEMIPKDNRMAPSRWAAWVLSGDGG